MQGAQPRHWPMASKRSNKTYHLVNDYHLLAYETVDSTNEEARRLAEGGAAHGAVIWAKDQTAGRGRLKREWESKPGNLFVSLLLSPECALNEAAQLSFLAATAAVQALHPLVPGQEFACKWPNDIMLGDKKLGGILLESFSTQPEGTKERKQWVVVGVGINVDSCPSKTLYPATCLREAGVQLVSAKIVLTRFLESFMENYDSWVKEGFAPIRKSWLSHAYGMDKPVTVQLGEGAEVKGVFTGISKTGEMQLTDGKGQQTTINCGDVFFNPVKAITTHSE